MTRNTEINRKCRICKKTKKILVDGVDWINWQYNGMHVQNAFPYLSPNDREILISDICGDCFDRLCGDEE